MPISCTEDASSSETKATFRPALSSETSQARAGRNVIDDREALPIDHIDHIIVAACEKQLLSWSRKLHVTGTIEVFDPLEDAKLCLDRSPRCCWFSRG